MFGVAAKQLGEPTARRQLAPWNCQERLQRGMQVRDGINLLSDSGDEPAAAPRLPLRLDAGVGSEHGRELPDGEEIDARRDALECSDLLAEQPGGTK